ncbi:hypothetical protein [Thioclava arctica]|uniref:hypothetical protein n=1 Tax=Thioclava arctica TaxID=3238301 RepID=UPI003F5FF3B2
MGWRNFANTKKTVETPADLKGMKIRTVVVDGFYALQQATFASPKRKSIKAYQDFKSEGDQIYATPAQKAEFEAAAKPVYNWFKMNVNDGDQVFGDLETAVAQAKKTVDFERARHAISAPFTTISCRLAP